MIRIVLLPLLLGIGFQNIHLYTIYNLTLFGSCITSFFFCYYGMLLVVACAPEFLSPEAERQRSFSNAELSIVRPSVVHQLFTEKVDYSQMARFVWYEASFGRY